MDEKSNSRIVLNLFILLFLSIISLDCANQLPPGGGPVDLTPPEVLSVYPADGTVNFKDDHLEIEFSEYVDKVSFQSALFISPAFQGQLEYEWSGHSVRVNFPEKLKDNITYVVTIGTDVVDLHNKNRMAHAYSFSFSTGNKIDKGFVDGKIYDAEPSGIMLFAYALDSDTVDPGKVKPKYLSQAGKAGDYSLKGLSFGKYRIFAVKDEFKDYIYDIGTDSYGAPYTDISLTEKDTAFKGLNFFITKEDTAKPRLISAAMTDRFHILVDFSEPIDSTLYSSKNFYLIDSTLNSTIMPVYAFQGRGKSTQMVLALKEQLSEQDNIFLFAKELKDKSGNLTKQDYSRISVTNKADTSASMLVKTVPAERSSDVDVSSPEITFFFDDGFDSLKVKNSAVSVLDRAGAKYPFNIRFIDDATFIVKILAELKPRQDYFININLNYLQDVASNRQDSTYKFAFTTFTGTDFTGVSGEVKTSPEMSKENIVVVLQNTEKGKPSYKKKAGPRLEYDFNKVIPGKYLIWSFQSKKSSTNYNYGKPFPFKPSDKFTFYPDTLNLRARWPQSDVTVSY
ncbi:MAG: Ig-like domain-containing protein [Bacteroidota bacterium]|nr:Ig-like domain-containing protein [Bacteroidota bacterium]MDP4196204.1 Ig-like domain-containing protein [Bacteroidota bacterium]